MRASVSHANLLSFSYNINGTVSVCMCMCVHAWQGIWWINASTCVQVFCSCKPLTPGAPQDESESGLCHSSLAYLYHGHCVQEERSDILCQYIIMHAVSLLWFDKMIGGGWEEGIIQCVAPAGWTWCPRSSLIYREASVLATSHLSPVHSHHCHESQHWLTIIWLADFMFELSESNRIGCHPMTRVWLDDIVFVPGDSSLIGWHFARPIRVILFGPVCFYVVCLDGLVRW